MVTDTITGSNKQEFRAEGSTEGASPGSYVRKIRELEHQRETLARRNVFLTVLSQTTLKFMHQRTLGDLLQHMVDQIVDQTACNGAYIHMVHETGDTLDIVAARGHLSEMLLGKSRQHGEGLSASCWDTGELQFASDYLSHESCILELTTTFQACAIPLISYGHIDGVVLVTAHRDSDDLRQQLHMLEEIAKIASAAIWQTRQTETTALELKRSNALSDLSKLFGNAVDLDLVMSEMCATVMDVFEVARIDTVQVQQDSSLTVRHEWSMTHEDAGGARELTAMLVEQGLCRWTADNRVVAFSGRLDSDDRESANVRSFRKNAGLGCVVCIPVAVGKDMMGVLQLHRSHEKRDFDTHEINSFMSIASQISTTIERMKLLGTIRHQARHDRPTCLPNRRYFEQTLDELIGSDGDSAASAAVLYMDLDGFKYINDTHGHAMGDQVLCSVSKRFDTALGDECFLARVGGDEFAAIIPAIKDKNCATAIAERVIDSLSEAVNVEGYLLKIGASAGLSFYPQDGQTTDELIHKADEAMYQAKSHGAGSVQIFNEALALSARYKARLQLDLKKAIHDDQFHLVFQPKVSMDQGKVNNVEALIRWNHPERGEISPKDFIPVAEETGLIAQIGAWVLEETCREIASWAKQGDRSIRVAINVSSAQFMLSDFVDQLMSTLGRYRVSPDCLELELTESVVMYDIKSVVSSLHRLRQWGVRIAIDDFGTGYSSLSYLRDLPVDVLKIDRAFISQLDGVNDRKSLVNIIILMAAGLDLKTVVEGVEEQEELDIVSRLGCDYVQGYYYSRPVTSQDLPAVIEQIESCREVRVQAG